MFGFLRTKVLPWGVWLAAMGGAAYLWVGINQGGSRGFVETAVYGVSAPQTKRVATLTTGVGQRVRAGDVVATLDDTAIVAELEVLAGERERLEAELAAVESNTKVSLSETKRGIEESVDAADRAHQEAKAQRKIAAAELAALDRQVAHIRELVDKRMADRRELVELEVSQAALKKELQQAETLIRQLQRQAGSARARRGDVPGDVTVRATEPLRAELAVVGMREQLLQLQREALTLRAPGDGEVTAVHLRAGEVATEGAPILTITGPASSWRAGTPTVRVCVDEEQGASVVAGEAVTLRAPTGRGAALPGRVAAVSPDVAQLPARCWSDPRTPQWGRSIYVVLDDPMPLVPGSSFAVEFLGRPSEHAADVEIDGAPVSQVSPDRTPTATAAASPRPAVLPVPAALAERSRFEPSGLAWASALQRYIIVSDDTGHRKRDEHAPWLFTMSADGRIDEAPLVIEGLKEVRDLESIAPAPGGGFYLLSSQSRSRKGKRHAARTQLVHVVLDGRTARAVARVSFAAALDAADPGLLASLSVPSTDALEIEGMTATERGGVLLGLKAPLTASGEAILWHLPDPTALLRSGSVADAGLTVWGTVPLRVLADGVPVPGGVSELLELADGSLLVAATASTRADPAAQDGVLVQLQPAGAPRVVATFPGLKPEGLSVAPGGDGVVIVFDAGAEAPRWVEQPWPAS